MASQKQLVQSLAVAVEDNAAIHTNPAAGDTYARLNVRRCLDRLLGTAQSKDADHSEQTRE